MPKAIVVAGVPATNAPPGPIIILRLPAVLKRRGRSRSSHYQDVKEGLYVKPVLIGLRAAGTPDHEVDTLNAARIAGKSDNEMRELVKVLHAKRTELFMA